MMQRVSVSLDDQVLKALERVQERQRWSQSKAAAYLIEKGIEARFPKLLAEAETPASNGSEE